jgi:PAS domain S-box-containing protein
MIDETNRIPKAAAAPSIQQQIHDVAQNLEELTDVLRDHQSMLRLRGMNLPANSLETFKLVQSRLSSMTKALTSRQIELRQLRALAQTTAVINSTLDVDSVLNQVIDTVIQLTGAERGFILLKSAQTGDVEFRIARGVDNEQLNREDFKISKGIINKVLTTGEVILADDAKDDERFQNNASVYDLHLRSVLAVPLIVGGIIIGVVYCDNRIMKGLFSEHEQNLLAAFAGQAAVAIQNANLFADARARLAEINEVRDLMNNVFSSVASGIITLDPRGVIIAFNPAAEQITRVSMTDALNRYLPAILPDFAALIGETLNRVVANRASESVEAEVPLVADYRVWKIAISPLRDAQTGGIGAALVLDDLTDERAREAQIREAKKYLPVASIDNLRAQDFQMMNSQEREISVLFADVRDFTRWSEELQPEDLMTIINNYLSVASDAIDFHKGIVDKYIGDAVTGLFNTPLNPNPDHALAAVRAAMGIRSDVQGLHDILPEEQRLRFGIGIHTGTAVLGNVGSSERREYSAIGDAMDLSKLLQENAKHGDIILSQATFEQVKDHFRCEALTPEKTKGRADFTVMYKVIGVKRGTAALDDY